MPAASLQSRIQAFEALSSTTATTASLSTPGPTQDHPASSSSLLETPISPTASTLHPIAPFMTPISPGLACQTSLIDLGDWIVEDGPVQRPLACHHMPSARKPKLNAIRESSRTPSPPPSGATNPPIPLINLRLFPKPRPPLPPRKPSFNTTDRVPTQRNASESSKTDTLLRPPGCYDTLPTEHTYPPGTHGFGTGRVRHAPATFHSISLSSDGSNVESKSPKISPNIPSFTSEADGIIADYDTASIAESFENISVASAVNPSTAIPFDWEPAVDKLKASHEPEPPGLRNQLDTKIALVVPPKPLASSVSMSSTATSTKSRRPPPPPPYQPRSRLASSRALVVSTSVSTSDRSSTPSTATTTSRTSFSTQNSAQLVGNIKPSPLLRPTPVPLAARSRYESLFDSVVQGRRKADKKSQRMKQFAPPPLSLEKGRQTPGWRSLSIDMTASPEGHPVLSSVSGFHESDGEEESCRVPPEERLNGRIVDYIWSASHLHRKKLRSIWNDCDPQCTGFIDRDAFVNGMWRIDEELRRAQLARRTSALAAASSQRIPHRPLSTSRP